MDSVQNWFYSICKLYYNYANFVLQKSIVRKQKKEIVNYFSLYHLLAKWFNAKESLLLQLTKNVFEELRFRLKRKKKFFKTEFLLFCCWPFNIVYHFLLPIKSKIQKLAP